MKKRTIIVFLIINLILAGLLLFTSLSLMSIVNEPFRTGVKLSSLQSLAFNIGAILGKYLLSLGMALSQKLQISIIRGTLGYISAFIMTIPVTVLFLFIFKKIVRRKGSVDSSEDSKQSTL